MKIAVVHSFYRSDQPSGENIAVIQQNQALRNAGHEVHEIFRYSDVTFKQPFFKLKSAGKIATGIDFDSPRKFVEDLKVDLVHVHNTIPNFGTRWLAKLSIPVVTTLHNFRPSCANGLLYRNNQICLDCPTTGSKAAVIHGCYQGSRLASFPLAIATARGAKGDTLLNISSAIITQSERVKTFMVEQGVPEKKLHLIPGFVEERHMVATAPPKQPRFLFVGRDTPEKGLSELLEIWPHEFPIDVIGPSTCNFEIDRHAVNVQNLGYRSREFISQTLPSYSALVFPGRVWEGAYPLVLRESLEAGVPVIALAGSSCADFIKESKSGTLYAGGSTLDIRMSIYRLLEQGIGLRQMARDTFILHFAEVEWITRIRTAYSHAIRNGTR